MVSCSTPLEEGIDAPTSQARGLVNSAAQGFQESFRKHPGRGAVTKFSERLVAHNNGSNQVVVLNTASAPSHGEVAMAVYSRADGARDGDPFGHWTVRMCVTLVAEGSTDAQVTVEGLTCPEVQDPPFAEVDATVDY